MDALVGGALGDVLAVDEHPPGGRARSPDATRSSVLLPAPLGPSTATLARAGTVRLTPRSTVFSP